MLKYIIRLFSVLLFITLSACDSQPETFHHSTLQFGTLIDITLSDTTAEQAQAAFAKLDEDFAYLHNAWSPWVIGSLRRTNGLIATGKSFSAGPSILPLIENTTDIAIKTDHLYNPAIGELINMWQFHRHDEPDIAPPDEASIQRWLEKKPRMTDLKRDGIKMYSSNPAVSLNFGGYAKGYAIDLEIQQLKSMGIHNAIINTGGDLKAIGTHGNRPWNIAIRHPRKDTWLAQLKTQGDEGVFTSGDYQRYYLFEGRRYHHILDPRTGYPADASQSVTVVHQDSGLADAAATALFIAGPDTGFEMAKRLGIKQVLLVDKQGKIHVSPELHRRLSYNPEIETTIIVTPPL